jgi:hypothetical protein
VFQGRFTRSGKSGRRGEFTRSGWSGGRDMSVEYIEGVIMNKIETKKNSLHSHPPCAVKMIVILI